MEGVAVYKYYNTIPCNLSVCPLPGEQLQAFAVHQSTLLHTPFSQKSELTITCCTVVINYAAGFTLQVITLSPL